MSSSIANSYVVTSLGLAARTVGDVLALFFACGYFMVVATTMLFTRRLSPRVGMGRFLLGIVRRRSQTA